MLQVDAAVLGFQAMLQLRGDVLARAGMVLHGQRCLPLDELDGLAQSLPEHSGAQDVVTGDHLFERGDEALALVAGIEGEHGAAQVDVVLGRGDVVVQQATLQRRERVDVLYVADTAIQSAGDAVDFRLGERDQRQQLGGDASAAGADRIGGDADHGRGRERLAQAAQCRGVE